MQLAYAAPHQQQVAVAPAVQFRADAHIQRTGRLFTFERLLPLVLAFCIVRLWVMPLFSSFWVDEMGTVFVVRHGAADPSLLVAPQVPASLYYALPRLSQWLFGGSEFAYRLPSLVALAVAIWFIARLARRLIHPAAGWFAVFACLVLRDFNAQASDARPYALGICAIAAGFWLLVRWLDSGRLRDAVLFAMTAALVWRIHLVFWPIYIVYALYAIWRLAGRSSVSRRTAAAVFAAIGLSLIPVAKQALAIDAHASAHVVAPLPSAGDLMVAFKFSFVMMLCGLTALASRWLKWPSTDRTPSSGSWVLILGWWLVPATTLFAFSHVTGDSVFVGRYLAVALPGIALAATAMTAAFLPTRYFRTAAVALGVSALLFGGRWGRMFPLHYNSDWRGAALALNREAAPDVPVICPSPFVEAQSPVWHPAYPLNSFLYSNLLVYRIRGLEIPFPFETSRQTEEYAAHLSAQRLAPAGRFFIYGGKNTVDFWASWFRARPELAGWRAAVAGRFGDVALVELRSPAAAASAARPPASAIPRRF
jgi:hypothetical protein